MRNPNYDKVKKTFEEGEISALRDVIVDICKQASAVSKAVIADSSVNNSVMLIHAIAESCCNINTAKDLVEDDKLYEALDSVGIDHATFAFALFAYTYSLCPDPGLAAFVGPILDDWKEDSSEAISQDIFNKVMAFLYEHRKECYA